MKRIPVVAVIGPTASGKSDLAVEICRHFGGEVVSADSMQIYKGMDIATAKPTEEEKKNIPHHMMDFLDNSEDYSVALYQQRRNALPIFIQGACFPLSAAERDFTSIRFSTTLSSARIPAMRSFAVRF